MMADQPAWGSDATPSLPDTLEDPTGAKVPMGGFCFTPLGLRVDITEAEREELLMSAFKPPGGLHG